MVWRLESYAINGFPRIGKIFPCMQKAQQGIERITGLRDPPLILHSSFLLIPFMQGSGSVAFELCMLQSTCM